jgi:hypothetical protein
LSPNTLFVFGGSDQRYSCWLKLNFTKDEDLSTATATVERFKEDTFKEKTQFMWGPNFYVNEDEIATLDYNSNPLSLVVMKEPT